MLYPYRLALEKTIPLSPSLVEASPTDRLLRLVCSVSDLFSTQPFPLYKDGRPTLLLLYRDVAYSWKDLADSFGDTIAAVSDHWPLSLYGTTGDRETGQLTIRREGGRGIIRLHSVSGRPFDSMEGLCLQLETESADTASSLAQVCSQLSPQAPLAALSRKLEPFLTGCSLLPTTGSAFCYLAWSEAEKPALLGLLSAAQKEQLWQTFLADGVQPLEFDWLWDAYCSGEAPHLLEWEMALRVVLEELGFSIQRQEGFFQVTDAQGQILRFDLVKGGPAEKIFLKLLFPLDWK